MTKRDKDDESADPRVAATGKISGTMVAALAIGIPLVLVLKSPVVVFWVICGAALAIAGVWLSGQSKAGESKAKKIADLEATIEDLKERLENVEVINHYETRRDDPCRACPGGGVRGRGVGSAGDRIFHGGKVALTKSKRLKSPISIPQSPIASLPMIIAVFSTSVYYC